MPLEDILAVETLEEESFRMKNMFQVRISPLLLNDIQGRICDYISRVRVGRGSNAS